jgi:hypothetical protein
LTAVSGCFATPATPSSTSESRWTSSPSRSRWRARSRSSCTPASSCSLGRLGLLIHSTAGFIDPGFGGNITLELSNVANLPITIYHGMPIGQISFMRMDQAVENPYGAGRNASKYQGQAEPTPSRFYLNFPQR